MISGQRIYYLPGTTVEHGGYMWGYITTTGKYCAGKAPTIVTAVENEEVPAGIGQTFFTLYPNPTSGNFVLEQKGEKVYNTFNVEVYGMRGEKILAATLTGEKKHDFGFSEFPAGLYFVKVISGEYIETIKLIKTR